MIFFDVAYSAVKDMGLIIPKPPNRGERDNSFLSVSPGAGLALSAGISCSRIEDSITTATATTVGCRNTATLPQKPMDKLHNINFCA